MEASSSAARGVWSLAAALSGATSPDDVAAALAEEGAAAAGAGFSNLARYEAWSDRVIVTHGSVLDQEIAVHWGEFELDEDTPLGTAIIYGQPVFLASMDQIAERYPALGADTMRAGLSATASLPLRSADGSVIGAVGFGWAEPQPFDEAQVTIIGLTAHLAEHALDRALLYERERKQLAAIDMAQAQLLQNAFVPVELPETPGLDVAAAYLPASGAPMGGDWYDIFPVDTGMCLVIGDVAGHGLRSTAVMAELRNGIRAFATEDPSPARILTRVHRLLCRLEPDETASAIVAVFDPTECSLVRANAGHPPLLRCRPGELAYRIPRVPGLLLGVDPSREYHEETTRLRTGSTLLFYTDGLIENRGSSLDQGMAEVSGFVETLVDYSPAPLCDAILRWRTSDPARDDDLCILAARVRPEE